MSVYTPREGDLALVTVENAEPALARYVVYYDDGPDDYSAAWQFFGVEWAASPDQAQVVCVVQEMLLVAPEEVTRDGETQG